jgi:hypothetical protein
MLFAFPIGRPHEFAQTAHDVLLCFIWFPAGGMIVVLHCCVRILPKNRLAGHANFLNFHREIPLFSDAPA